MVVVLGFFAFRILPGDPVQKIARERQILLLMVFAGKLQWLPTGGMVSPGIEPGSFTYVVDVAKHLILPVITMTAVIYAQYLMVMRASLLGEMSADYLTTAHAKGL
ncbi:ABC transporter permease subunit, partial [Brevibacterium paucivorans]